MVEYFQLAHNERHPETRKPVARIIHNFGRADQLDRQELVRLCKSIARVCGIIVIDPLDEPLGAKPPGEASFFEDLKIRKTRAFGCPMVIEALWERLGLKKTLEGVVNPKGLRVPYERALLAMTANRLCDPESKLGVWDRWLSKVYLPSCNGLQLKHMYEAMDLLYAHADKIEEAIFFHVADLFNLEVDLIFYDTTTASFHVDQEDDPDRHANPKEAERQRKHREMTVAILEKELESHKDASATAQWAIELLASRRFKRYLTVTKTNKVRIDRAKIREAKRYDGK